MNFCHRGHGGVTEDEETNQVSALNHSVVYSVGSVLPSVLSVSQLR